MLSVLTGSLYAIVSFILVFGIIVLLHEFGHFIVARLHGVRVLEFGIGFPPRLWSTTRGNTIYSINLIPLGGFVRTLGQNDFGPSEKSSDPGNFLNKSVWQRSQIILAGIVMNVLLTIALLTIGYAVGSPPLLPTTPGYDEAVEEKGVIVREILPDAPAASSMLLVEDTIIAADNVDMYTNLDLTAYARNNAGREIILTVLRDGTKVTIPVTVDRTNGQLGVLIANDVVVHNIKLPVDQAFTAAVSDTYHAGSMTLAGLGDALKRIITTFTLTEDLTGPIGIIKITYDVVQMGFLRVMQLAAILSVTIAVLNVIPFPGLDGGHFAFIVIEAIRGKRLSPLIEARIHVIGMMLLILLAIAVTIQDVGKLMSG